MTFTLRLTPLLRQQLYRRLQQAYASGFLRLVKRLHALLAIAEGMTSRTLKVRGEKVPKANSLAGCLYSSQ